MAASTAIFTETPIARQESGKWIVAGSVLLGVFIAVMDATIVNVAMPHMMGSFGTDLITITWVATGYSIAAIIMITMAAWFSTLIGRKRLYLISMIVFIIGSVLCGMTRSFSGMVVFRLLQGFGGGALMPLSQAIVREKFPPEEQGVAMSIFTMGIVLAPATGPVIGGWLIDNYGWPWIFYINIPFCVVGTLMVSAFVQDPPYLKRGLQRVDWCGIGLLTVGLTLLQVVLERGQEVDWFASHSILIGSIVAAVSLVGLVIWEIRQKEPVINFRLFRNTLLSVGSAYSSLASFAMFGSTFLLPQLVQNLLGYPALPAGLIMIPRSIAMLFMMPLSGRLYNYINPRIMVTLGMLAMAYANWKMGHMTLMVGFWSFAPWLVLFGAGMSFSAVIVGTISLSTIAPQNMTQASALSNLTQRVAGNVAYALLATILFRRTQFHRSMLSESVSFLNPAFLRSGLLGTHGMGIQSLAHHGTALAMVNGMLNRQAAMMAFNDVSCLLALTILPIMPLVLLLPNKGVPDAIPEVME